MYSAIRQRVKTQTLIVRHCAKYHQKLWSKKLPNGISFDLTLEHPRVLYHSSELGE